MDDDEANEHIKPGFFAIPSKIENREPSYEGLHSEEWVSLSYVEEEIEADATVSISSLSSSISTNQNTKKNDIENKNTSKTNLKEVPYTFTWDEGGKKIKVTGTLVK